MESELLAQFGFSCLSGTVTILLVYLVCRLFPRLPGAVRASLWWLVCFKLLLGLVPLPVLPVAVLPNTTQVLVAPQVVEQQPETTDTVTSLPVADTDISVPSANDTEVDTEAPTSPFPVAKLLLLLWLTGVGVGIGMQWMALVQLRRLTIGATRQESTALEEAARRAVLRSTPKLWITSSPIEPLTVGCFAPVSSFLWKTSDAFPKRNCCRC